jgi:tetratricopeptide (TPR) repeat protein
VTALSALRADLARSPQVGDAGREVELWVALATALERSTVFDDGSFAFLREVISSLRAHISNDDEGEAAVRTVLEAEHIPTPDRIAAAIRVIVRRMENLTAFSLADETLRLLQRRAESLSILERGRVMQQRARIARHRGDFSTAEDLYHAVGRLGREHRLSELTARSLLGPVTIARIRGNLPAAARLARRGLQAAIECDRTDLITIAHHECLVTSAKRGDVSAALVHGWAYLQHAQSQYEQVVALLNIAAALEQNGHYEDAFSTFRLVLSRRLNTLELLPALGGLALTAARLRKNDQAREYLQQLDALTSRGDLFWEVADAMREAACAWLLLGDVQSAERCASIAQAVANRHGFHEIAFSIESLALQTARTAPRQKLTAPAAEVREHLASMSAELAAAGASSEP